MQYLSQDLILLALNPQTGKTRFSWYAALEYGAHWTGMKVK
ncbi:GPP34 family phosphoprotein [Kovacikia minuta CCNUW1]|nr:GPP34 family phosphoprotein [Kovacikia minuta]UBF24019.1 GPP34 family phosphoprotein [Kovacikia minuta CCNUW1]